MKTENHETDRITDAMKILHIAPKGYHMNILEEIEIYTHLKESPDEILNEQTELKHTHLLILKEKPLYFRGTCLRYTTLEMPGNRPWCILTSLEALHGSRHIFIQIR